MRVFAALDPRLPLSQVPAVARRMEALGFDGIHIPETIHDSFAVALLAAEHTTRITLRTAITLAFVRSPTVVAYGAWDLAAFSGGRFELGLGTQIKQNIEGRYGMPWTEPVSRMGEYVEAVRELFAAFASGGPVRYDGEHYRLTRMQPYFNPGPTATAPPVLLGAVNPGMCTLAGRLADGVITHSTNSDPGYLREVVRPALEKGAAAAGRTTPGIIASAPVALGATAEGVARERERMRRLLAFLYSTPSYKSTLVRLGLPELFDRLRDLVQANQWDRLSAVMTDDVLDALLICADYAALPDLLRERYDGLAEGVVLSAPADDGADDRLRLAIEDLRSN
ncbi:TIGR03617 family F420-dependent LLM class oxidoreductase [Nocardia tengchongensis]|uniref:TIGR03617 family F420-dependent LLM class oxidoreductase n=1 Tax=Nocardia tengchongensis TaxID=2055889 RepID=UPI003688DD54